MDGNFIVIIKQFKYQKHFQCKENALSLFSIYKTNKKPLSLSINPKKIK